MTVSEDAGALLKFLVEVEAVEDDPHKGHHEVPGRTVTTELGMAPLRVNDAVELLENRGLGKVLRFLGGAPYTFHGISATAEGRAFYQEQMRANAEKAKAAGDANAWDTYPDGDAADLVPLLKRAAFDRDLVRACLESSSERPVALLMVDIDHFKQVNDTCGHPGGDKVLIVVAGLLRRVVGRKGRCYRYGGEELSALLPDFTTDEAAATAERFRGLVEAQGWADAGYPELRVRVSVGVAESAAGAAEALVASADAALYASKRNGRNRVTLAPDGR